MSTSYAICCETCGEILTFGDNNNAGDVMLTLCRHADEIAAMLEVLTAIRGEVALCDLAYERRLDVSWFKKHLGHELVPIDEYGHKMNACQKPYRIECAGGHSHGCGLERDHDGECRLTRNSNPYNARVK